MTSPSDLIERLRTERSVYDAELADEAADEIERLQKRNALLERVAVAAERCIPDVGYIDDHDLDAMAAALDKLREVSDE